MTISIPRTLCYQLWLAVVLCLSCDQSLTGQTLPPHVQARHQLGLSAGYDHTILALRLSYARLLPTAGMAIGLEATQGSALLGSDNYALGTTVAKWWGLGRKLFVRSGAAITFTSADNLAARARSLGVTVGAAPVYRAGRYAIGVDLSYTAHLATHLRHSAHARKYLYDNAVDGWYGFTARNIRLGGLLTRSFGSRHERELTLSGGYQTTGRFDRLLPRVYLNIDFNQILR